MIVGKSQMLIEQADIHNDSVEPYYFLIGQLNDLFDLNINFLNLAVRGKWRLCYNKYTSWKYL